MDKIFFTARAYLVAAFIGTTQLAIAGGATIGGCLIAGPQSAPVTIEEFADFECKYCVRGSNTMKEVLKNYSGKVNLVFRNMPLPMHSNSVVAAKAFTAVCLQSPSLAFSFQRELFDNQDQFIKAGEAYLSDTAEKLGVNVQQMRSDMIGEAVAKLILEDQRAADSHNFKGTPSFKIGSELVNGAWPYDEIKKVIDRQLGR